MRPWGELETNMRGINQYILAALIAGSSVPAVAVPGTYEPGIDPGVGFNLISWSNFGTSGGQVFVDTVQEVYDAGFREVSINPVRYAQISGPNAGQILTTSGKGPELSHIEMGILRAKSLGMTVTVNPFVELIDGGTFFPTLRGFYNPTPGSAEANRFWADYESYMVDVAQVAQSAGADSMTVGTEYRAMVQNSGNNASWNTVINAIDGVFSGSLGYAANWDNYKNNNLKNAIWNNPAIDYVGIDAYFRNMSNSQADASGTNPNPAFIGQVESAWNWQLDNDILPYVQSLQGGAGLPVAFTEFGYLPYNRTVTQNAQVGTPDQDEQIMGFQGLLNAMDQRRTNDGVLGMDFWQWGMPGSAGSLWNMNTSLAADQPLNTPATEFLSTYVNTGLTPPPVTRVETLLFSWETGLEGWQATTFFTTPTPPLLTTVNQGATDGAFALSIQQTSTGGWSWNARAVLTPGDADTTAYQALSDAAADPTNYLIEFDVTFDPALIDDEVTSLSIPFAIQSDAGWGQIDSVVSVNTALLSTQSVSFSLTGFDVVPTTGSSFYDLVIGLNGSWLRGNTTILIDNFRVVQLLNGLPGDLDGDGFVGIADLNIVLGAWNQSVPPGDPAADPSGDGFVGIEDLNVVLGNWNAGTPPVSAVPEPGTLASLIGLSVLVGRRRGRPAPPRRAALTGARGKRPGTRGVVTTPGLSDITNPS
jgi:Glycoside Hydrolase Family 113